MSKKESQALARRRAENRRQAIKWNIIVLGGLGLFLVIVVSYTIYNLPPGPLPGEMVISDEGQGHLAEGVALPAFHHDPPSSGTHYPRAADWGLSTVPITPSIYLHNLGIGGVVFLYNCATPCPDLEKQFADLYSKAPPDSRSGQKKILITPYETALPTPIVALAWAHQLNLANFDEKVMLLWYKRFLNKGPEPAP